SARLLCIPGAAHNLGVTRPGGTPMPRSDYEDDRPRSSRSAEAAAGAGIGIAVIIIAVGAGVGLGVIVVLIGLLLPAVPKVRSAPARMQGANNLKQVALALHTYHDSYGRFPPPHTTTPDGKPGVSWRVLILPFIEQDNLYKMFRLDEPWDSPNNAQWSNTVVMTYCHPADGPTQFTRLRIFVGGGAPFEHGKKTVLMGARGPDELDFRDGTSNTFMVVEAADLVPWAKPDELPYDPKGPLPKLGARGFG